MESVAARAKTGVAVLYRRWPRKDDLVLAAIAEYGRTHPVEIPDTGSLRGDMLALLGSVNDQRSSFTAVVTAAFTGLLASTGLSPADVRARLLGDRPMWSNDIYRRAHERGELDLDKVPPAVLSMPFDLMRHDLFMTLKPVPAERLASIVDDLFLPLVAAYRGTVRSGAWWYRSPPGGSPRCRHVAVLTGWQSRDRHADRAPAGRLLADPGVDRVVVTAYRLGQRAAHRLCQRGPDPRHPGGGDPGDAARRLADAIFVGYTLLLWPSTAAASRALDRRGLVDLHARLRRAAGARRP